MIRYPRVEAELIRDPNSERYGPRRGNCDRLGHLVTAAVAVAEVRLGPEVLVELRGSPQPNDDQDRGMTILDIKLEEKVTHAQTAQIGHQIGDQETHAA